MQAGKCGEKDYFNVVKSGYGQVLRHKQLMTLNDDESEKDREYKRILKIKDTWTASHMHSRAVFTMGIKSPTGVFYDLGDLWKKLVALAFI